MSNSVPLSYVEDCGCMGWANSLWLYCGLLVVSYSLLIFTGSVLRCDVTGKILMKCFLSGMPDLKLGLNDKIGLEKESQLKARPTKR